MEAPKLLKLSPTELKVFNEVVSGARDDVAAVHLRLSEHSYNVHKTNIRRKIANAEQFLADMKPAAPYLYPKRQYKGITKRSRR